MTGRTRIVPRRSQRLGTALVVMAVVAIAVAGVTPASAKRSAARGTMHHVSAAGGPSILFEWDPAELTIAVGDKVMWMNPTTAPHRVVPYEGSWDTPLDLPAENGEASFKFKEAGVYLYRCDVPSHSVLVGTECVGMCGTITVE